MKKSLLALALCGACAAAQAQSAVQIYGNLDLGVIKRTGQSTGIGKRANNTLGFKGTEALGSDLNALFQLEIRYEPDTGLIETGARGIQRPLFQGSSRVGLQGAFGTIRLGRGLTAFQESSIAFEPFHGIPTQTGFQADLGVAGYDSDPLGLPSNSTNRFSNAIFYNSPVLSGFQLNTTVASREANGNAALTGRGTTALPQYAANSGGSVNPFSISATYKNGPAAMMMAYERNAVETNLRYLGVSIMSTPETKLMLSMARQDQSHTRLINQATKAWVLGANHTMGAGKILFGYGHKHVEQMNKVKQFSLGYEYSLSKRTYLYADASNKKGAPLVSPSTTTSINHLTLGVNHSF